MRASPSAAVVVVAVAVEAVAVAVEAVAVDAPLAVAVEDSWGEAAAWSNLAVWIGDQRLSGQHLAWLTGARPTTDRRGFWRAVNLPPGPVQVLAWRSTASAEATSGRLDSLARSIEAPWPEPVKLVAVE